VVDTVREQHGRIRERLGDACRWLFPKASGNPDGKYPMPYGTVDTRFDAWLKRIQLIDSNGDPATVSWHQFRHTLRELEGGSVRTEPVGWATAAVAAIGGSALVLG